MSGPESELTTSDSSSFPLLDALLARPTSRLEDGPSGPMGQERGRRLDTGLSEAPDSGRDRPPGDLRLIRIDQVRPNEFQPRRRFEEDSLAALTESIRELGVLQPILVRPRPPGAEPPFELVAGERRWRAARRAGLRSIPAIVRPVSDVESLQEAIVENLHRADLNALEEAAAYQQLIDDFALTQDQVASRVGKSRSAVANTLRLLQLPASVQRLVVSGELSAGHARAVLGAGTVTSQRRLADQVVAEELSVRETEERARLMAAEAKGERPGFGTAGRVPLSNVSSRERPVAHLEVERMLADLLDTRVGVEQGGRLGRIVIDFADDDDLERILQIVHRGANRR